MPAPRGSIVETLPTGFPDVKLVRYSNRPYWFARIYSPKTRSYALRGTNTEDEKKALRLVPELYTSWLQNPDEKKSENYLGTTQCIDKWIAHQESRCKRREITPVTLGNKLHNMKQILKYIVDKRLLRVKEIDPRKHFKDYVEWRLADGYNINTVRVEVKIIKEWISWLYQNKMVKDSVVNCPIPRQTHEKRQEEDESAEAFTHEQKKEILTRLQVKVFEAEGAEKSKWQQVLFFFELMCDAGTRTDELWNVKFGDVQVRDVKTIFQVENLVKIRVSKTGPRDTIFMSPTIKQIEAFLVNRKVKVTPETYLWTNPGTGQRWTKQFFQRRFRLVLKELGYSSKKYRLYSSRGWHITDAIERGVQTYILARNLGTSELMIRRVYENLMMERQREELLKGADGNRGDGNVFTPMV